MKYATENAPEGINRSTPMPFFNSQSAHTATVQAKLTVNEPGDQYEQEADAVADKVMRMPTPSVSDSKIQLKPIPLSQISRKCADCEKEEKIHRKESPSSGGQAAPSIVHDVISSSGQSLDKGTRQFMESRMGHDFSHVKIHIDRKAAESAASVNALAYTSGNHIVFNSGQYQPNTEGGKRLLAHELVHVGQQNVGATAFVQRQLRSAKCPDSLVVLLNQEMHTFCNQPRSCSLQNDDCATATAKVAYGNACIRARTELQQKCFSPGDIGYEDHMLQIAQASAALRNCIAVMSVKCSLENYPPVSIPVPESQRQRSNWEQIKEFAENAIRTGETSYQAIRQFLIDHPALIYTVIAIGVAGLVATFAEDIATLGAGILDDLVTVPFFARMISVAWELRQAIAAGTIVLNRSTTSP